jgi:hypothetical protein
MSSRASSRGAGQLPPQVIVAQEGTLDATIRQLRVSGLDLRGSIKLSNLAGNWARRSAPAFLKRGDDIEMFERLGSLNTATYRKLGQARSHLREVRDVFGRDYGPTADPGTQNSESTFQLSLDAYLVDEIERSAAFDCFLTALSSALDSLAGEAALLLNLGYSIWSAHFTTLVTALRRWEPTEQAGPEVEFTRRLKELVIGRFLDVGGSLADWFEQFLQFRHAAAHRPHLLWSVDVSQLRGHKFRFEHHLCLDTFARPSDVLIYPDEGHITYERANRTRAKFQRQSVSEYCEWLFLHVLDMVKRTYDILADVYKDRKAHPDNLRNDPDVLLLRSKHQQPTRFQGL